MGAVDDTRLLETDRRLAESVARRLDRRLSRSRPTTGDQIVRMPRLHRLADAAVTTRDAQDTVSVFCFTVHFCYDRNVTLIISNIGRQLLDGVRFCQCSGI